LQPFNPTSPRAAFGALVTALSNRATHGLIAHSLPPSLGQPLVWRYMVRSLTPTALSLVRRSASIVHFLLVRRRMVRSLSSIALILLRDWTPIRTNIIVKSGVHQEQR
jgi:hypothetical protein